jgi:hypothetical protein
MKNRKYLFTLLFTFFVWGLALGQSVDEFSGAKFLQIELVIPINAQPNLVRKDTMITVPANKVWKIESVSVGDSTNAPVIQHGGYGAVYLNNKNIYSSQINQINTFDNFPIWLPTGVYRLRFVDHDGTVHAWAIRHYFFVNITEWNTTP